MNERRRLLRSRQSCLPVQHRASFMKMRFIKSSRRSVPSRARAGWILLLAALFVSAPARAADIQLLRGRTPGAGESQQFTDIAGLQLDANGAVMLADGASGRVLSVQGDAWEGFAAGGKQRLFGGGGAGGGGGPAR